MSRAAFASRALRCAALGLALTVSAGVAPALALPGQTVTQFRTWAAGKTFFARNLESGTNELSGFPQFHVRSGNRGVAWDLQVQTDGHVVTQELFGMTDTTKDVGSEPIAHDGRGYGFTFFTSVYGAAVAADYRNAKLVATLRDASAKSTSTFYRGKKYGYEVTGGFVALQTPAYFAVNLAQERSCAKTPAACNE